MVSFDIELASASVRESLNDLIDEWDSDAVYVTGTNVEYAIYLEMGTRDMPPYPFFRPAIVQFKADPEGFITGNTAFNSVREIPNGDQLVRALATAFENQITANASALSAVERSPGVHPEHPKRVTGNLAASISAQRVK
jgi:hypothetical protein